MDSKILANFLLCDDAEIVVESFMKLQPDMRQSIVTNLVVMAQYANLKAPSSEPVSAAQLVIEGPKKPNFVTGETMGTRVIERRLAGETVVSIAQHEKTDPKTVRDILREARNNGVDVRLIDRAPQKPPEPISRRPPDLDLREYIFAQRMAGIPPFIIPTMAKRDFKIEIDAKYVSNTISRMKRIHNVNALAPLSKEGLAMLNEHSTNANDGGPHLPIPAAVDYPFNPAATARKENLVAA